MSATRKNVNSKKSAKKRNSKPTIDLTTWNTTDEDERERRRIRAAGEQFTIINRSPLIPYFSHYTVTSKKSKKCYQVEIRSLSHSINSCDCQDCRTNGLGTCKHVEAVLCSLRKKGVKKFKQASEIGSHRIEIFAIPGNEFKIKVLAPNSKNKSAFMEKIINPFFDKQGVLKGNPLVNFPDFLLNLKKIKNVKNHLRISSHIQYHFDYCKNNFQRQEVKNNYLKKVHSEKYPVSLKHALLPYQVTGMMHLALTERALLADEMGLGKTVQAIAACEWLRQSRGIKRVLVVSPASLKAEWEEQIAKFTDLSCAIIYGTRPKRLIQYQQPAFFNMMNYEQIVSDFSEIQSHLKPDVIILDEAQRIKNWRTKTANSVKELKSPYAFVLTGTPVENRIDDIYSIMQFLDPHLFGPLFRFNRDFYELDERGKPIGYKHLDQLYQRLRPVMLCRKKADIEAELPKRLQTNFFVKMSDEQRTRYEEYDMRVARLVQQAKHRPLRKEEFERLQLYLACMRMLCDTPYILDKNCKISPKLTELKLIVQELLEEPETKIIIFSEWERMLHLVKEMAEKQGWLIAWHTGSVIQHKRREEIRRFKDNKKCRLFLSTDSGSVGLNLQVANVVINLDLPWNPAKLEQRIARAWRKHQMRTVQVINLICENSIEHRMLFLLAEKQRMAEGVLTGDEALSAMKMPSGRAAFLERLEELMDITSENEVSSHEEPLDKTKNVPSCDKDSLSKIAVENFNDCLHVLQTYESVEGEKTVLAVLDYPDEHAKHILSSAAQSNSATLEVIDQETLALLQRLANAGILTLNAPLEILHHHDSSAAKQQRQNKQIEQADLFLAQAKRKQQMANVLINNDFLEEAFLPLGEALDFSIKAFGQLIDKPHLELSSLLLKELTSRYDGLDALPRLFEMLSHSKKETSSIKQWFNDHQTALDHLIKMRNSYCGLAPIS